MKDIIEIYDREKNKKIDMKIFLFSGLGLIISVISVLLKGNNIYITSFSDNIIGGISLILFAIMGLVYMKDEDYKGKYFLKFISTVLAISLSVFAISFGIFVNMAGSIEELYKDKLLLLYFALINNGIDFLILPYYFQYYKKLSYFECMEDKLKYLEKKNKKREMD